VSTTDPVGEAAARLVEAARTSTPCPPVRDLIGSSDVVTAYAVQRAVNAARVERGGRPVGRKIGLTSPAVQQQLGVDRPDFGVLFEDMSFTDGSDVPTARLLQPRAEAEVAFVLARDVGADDLDPERLRTAIDHVVAALEIVDSRIAAWDITFGDTVADNGSSGVFVLGSERVSLDDVNPIDVTMSMRVNDVEVSTGTGAACLGDPLLALAWLARASLDLGQPLQAGDVVLSGALGPMAPVANGDSVAAEIVGLGVVGCTFV
jgi:2-keto-4-pentenoate hydratase